ncbi:uncharacterized protein LOC113120174 [Carassius auratus]|uniref:Uncharacterized protein LOC113120174 n=1 Tax=Carassius auratus TaxID=7957 RepID=A0A6P6RJM4_CARAU|nr:uncharacterized protein LOC113120174 [Carassius auratus]
MARLSSCIFEWDAGDLTLLRRAKREQLIQQGWPTLTEAELDHHLTKAELLQHCRRRTRGEETTFRLLDMLIRELMGGKGNDALGVPLLDSVRMQHIWNVQRRHVTCIQDPPNVPLYTETGTTSKGGVVLKTYRCARGSTSLESFHCHLSRFIPGNSANSLNFQIYLLEGLLRWNQDQAEAAVADGGSTLRSYTGELVYSVNENYNKLYGRKLVPSFTPPAAPPLLSVQNPLDTPVPSAMAVDEHCIPGMAFQMDALAECLVELRTQTSLTLTNQQVATIVGLWQNLDKFDKDRVVYAARHQDRLLTGHFRSPKKKAVFTPGVDSTKRCFLGSSGSPAQWPNCCRLVEMIFIRLCNIHRSTKKQLTESLSRWDLILRDYRRIRQLILSNGTVMSDTTLQLVEVNQRTLTTWHNIRLKGQEVYLLLQGLDLPEARPVALDALPPARIQPVVPPQYSHQLHTYQMPPDTAGQAKTKFRKIAPSATCTSATATSIWPSAVHPQRSATSSQLRTICPRPTAPHPLVPDTPTAPVVS